MLQPGTQNISLHLLWRPTPKMVRTPSHGQICPQHCHSFSHQQLPLLTNHEIWTSVLPTPQKNLPSSSLLQTSGTLCLFPTSAIFTVPHPMGHDHKQWRDLFRDLEPVHRWWCSKHRLLKAKSIAFFFSISHFISNLFIFSSALLCLTPLLVIMLMLSCQHDYTSTPTS